MNHISIDIGQVDLYFSDIVNSVCEDCTEEGLLEEMASHYKRLALESQHDRERERFSPAPR